MAPGNDNKSFLDSRTILAFLLVMAFWFAWREYVDWKYPAPPVSQEQVATQETETPETLGTTAPGAPTQRTSGETAVGIQPESTLSYEDSNWTFAVSSKGMGLKDIVLKNYQTRAGEPISMGAVNAPFPFATGLATANSPLDFEIEQTGPRTFTGRARVGDSEITKTLEVMPDLYSVKAEIQVSGASTGFDGLVTYISDILVPSEGGSFFAPSYDHQEFFLAHDGTTSRHFIDLEGGTAVEQANINVAALSAHYFALAVVDHSKLRPAFATTVPGGAETATGRLVHKPVNRADSFQVSYTGYAGPKLLPVLTKVDEQLAEVVNYGMFSLIARPLVWLLNFFNSLFHNYGWAIVALTIVVRILVLPFNVYSYRSMKVMQLLQPQMKGLREKHKDDPVTLNKEVMDLMRRNKANPLGGCLPMLLQLPIFIALYQVLGQSIELYREPFILWIHDLSIKDPYYVLPILMGATLFIQQKITPTTMDPQQAKVMAIMPVVFTLFMVALPSGLTLYIFVSTLFGIVQQYVFLREKTANTSVTKVEA